MSSIAGERRLGNAAKAGYGVGALGIAAVEFFVRVYLLKLYTDTLGLAMFRAGDPAARAVLARAVEQDPQGAVYRLHLARAEAAAGDVEAARTQAETGLELDPEGPESGKIRDFLDGL